MMRLQFVDLEEGTVVEVIDRDAERPTWERAVVVRRGVVLWHGREWLFPACDVRLPKRAA
jgi:hypothetical protein